MPHPWSLRAALAASIALMACGGGDPLVQLRLHACDVDGAPGSVRLEVQAYDGGGAPVGAKISAAFTIPAGALADSIATVGYARPEAAATADFTIAWFAAATAGAIEDSEHVVVLTGVAVPAAGEAIDLLAEGCAPWMGGTSEGTTSEGTSAGTTSAGESDSTSAGPTTSGDPTTSGNPTTDATTADPTTSGDPTTDATTADTDTDTGTTGMEGMACTPGPDTQGFCVTPGPGEVGTLYTCVKEGMDGVWKVDTSSCASVCADPFYGFQKGVTIGCSGNGPAPGWGCLCKDDGAVVPCAPADQKCVGQEIQLCVDDELAKGSCVELCEGGAEPICGL